MREWEWETKGQGCWPFHFSALLYLTTFSLFKGLLVSGRESHKGNSHHALYRSCQNEFIEPHSKLVFPFGFQGR